MNRFVRYLYVFALVTGLSGVSCTELYMPEIDAEGKILVVQGLITDQPGPYSIQLSYTIPYDTIKSYEMVEGASVYVENEIGQRFHFIEQNAGQYYSDPDDFVSDPAMEYTLHITLPNGDEFVSTPEAMETTAISGEAYGSFIKKEYLTTDVFDQYITEEVDWIEVNLDARLEQAGPVGVRIQPTLVILSVFSRDPSGGDDVAPFFAWRTVNLDFIARFADDPGQLQGEEGQLVFKEMEVASFEARLFIKARDTVWVEYPEIPETYYPMAVDTMNSTIVGYLLVLDEYLLNSSGAAFYQSALQQLNNESRIFDPLPSQTIGNITAVTHPEQPVIGLFEVSGYQKSGYRIRADYFRKNMEIFETEPILPDPPIGWLMGVAPDFWD